MQADNSTDYKTVNLLGTEIHVLSMAELIGMCEEYIYKKCRLLIGVTNVAKLVNCRKSTELRESLIEADVVVADGLPIVWFSRLMGNPLPERIAGIDIMYQLLKLASNHNYRVFFLGAKQQVVQKVVEITQRKYPGVHVVGYRNGYFKESEDKDVAEQIKKSLADILFVAISSPKKEIFLRKWRDFMDVPVCHGVGGSFDVLAGVTKRAPKWMQKYGLEWLYRLIQEPRRMWKRYLVTNSIFIKLSCEAILRDRFGRLLRRLRVTPAHNPKKKVQ